MSHKEFPFTTVVVSCEAIKYPQIAVTVKIDVPRNVIKLILPQLPDDFEDWSPEAQEIYFGSKEVVERFWQGVHKIVVGINVEQVDLTSPETLRASEDEYLPPNFWEKFIYQCYLKAREKFFREET